MQRNTLHLPNKRRLIIAFVVILLLWVGVAVCMDLQEKWLLDKTLLRYAIYFTWLIAVALSGHFAWVKDSSKWIAPFWLRVYALVMFLLLLAGFLDVFVYAFSYTLKMYVQSFRLFFLSPVPLVLLYFFSRLGKKGSAL